MLNLRMGNPEHLEGNTSHELYSLRNFFHQHVFQKKKKSDICCVGLTVMSNYSTRSRDEKEEHVIFLI